MERIFVSSTFVDMQDERDGLRNNVETTLQNIAYKYGEYVRFIDLRWGIDVTKDTTDLLDVCFDEIDKSKQNFLLLLGNRYGEMLPVSGRLDLEKEELSATEQEVTYFLKKYYNEKYFRICDKSDSNQDERVEDFKKAIKNFIRDEYKKVRIKHNKDEWNKVENQLIKHYSDIYDKKWSKENNLPDYDKHTVRLFEYPNTDFQSNIWYTAGTDKIQETVKNCSGQE